MTGLSRSLRSLALILTVILPVSIAPQTSHAATPATLVGPDLEAEQVVVVALSQGVISYFNDQRELRRASISDFIQLRDIGDAPAPITLTGALLTLADGQRFAGQWIGVDNTLQALVWQHPTLGQFAAPLDDLVSITRRGSPLPASDTGTDVLRLANGDLIEGFVASITNDQIVIELAGTGTAVPIDPANIDAIRLANPDVTPSAGWHHLLLIDGSRLLIRQPGISADVLAFDVALPGQSMTGHSLDLTETSRIDFAASGSRLIELAARPMRVTAGGETFGRPTPPRIRAGAIDLHAPVTVHFDLPEGTSRFAATAELATTPDLADTMTRWSDMELIITVGDADPIRLRINGRQPQTTINVPADAATLTLELDPAINGPVLDRLRLRDAVLLQNTTDIPASESTP